MGQGALMWRPTAAESQVLATCEAIVYHHDGRHEVVSLDNLPKELATYVRQGERDEARKAAARLTELLRRQANTFRRGVKISKKLARAKGLL